MAIDLSRRSFFGTVAGAAVVGPGAAKDAIAEGISPATSLRFKMMDTAGLGDRLVELNKISASIGRVRDIGFDRQGDRYVYRTGYPAIDALRSVSGVHRERMEKRLYAFEPGGDEYADHG